MATLTFTFRKSKFENTIIFTEIIENWFGLNEDGNSDYDDSEDMYACDSGEMISSWSVNDGNQDCMDGSDEWDFYLRPSTTQDWQSGDEYYDFSGNIDVTSLGLEPNPTVDCSATGLRIITT